MACELCYVCVWVFRCSVVGKGIWNAWSIHTFFIEIFVCEDNSERRRYSVVNYIQYSHGILSLSHTQKLISSHYLLVEDDAGRTGDAGTLAPLARRKELGDIPPAALAVEGVDALTLWVVGVTAG
jgi:hypothetical protein